MSDQAKRASAKDRSPRYPAIDLQSAINRAATIYRREGKHAVPNEVAAKHWSLSPKSSTVLTTTAALRAYGLLADGRIGGGSGVVLTDLGVRLAADEGAVNPERPALLHEAALKPAVYREIWNHYGGNLPSDDLLEYHLKTDRGFTAEGARAFIRNFRATIRFAAIDAPEANGGRGQENDDFEPEGPGVPIVTRGIPRSPAAQVSPGRLVQPAGEMPGVQVPIARGEWATIHAKFPLSRAKWNKFLEMLEAMEFALVEDADGIDSTEQA